MADGLSFQVWAPPASPGFQRRVSTFRTQSRNRRAVSDRLNHARGRAADLPRPGASFCNCLACCTGIELGEDSYIIAKDMISQDILSEIRLRTIRKFTGQSPTSVQEWVTWREDPPDKSMW